jgi:hypothetical protein
MIDKEVTVSITKALHDLGQTPLHFRSKKIPYGGAIHIGRDNDICEASGYELHHVCSSSS